MSERPRDRFIESDPMAEDYPDGVLANVEIENTTIALGKDIHWVGRGTRLKNCVIDIRVSGRRFSLVDCTLVDCLIKTRRPLCDVQFREPRFLNCRFQGVYKGCEFGGFPFEDYPQVGGCAKGCDFTSASLDACRFGTECENNAWPGWPHLVILDPNKNREAWMELPFCLSLNWKVYQDLKADQPDFVTACVQELSMIDEDVDPEVVWPYVQEIPWLTFGDKDRKSLVTLPKEPPSQYVPPPPDPVSYVNDGWLVETNEAPDQLNLIFDMTRAMAAECYPEQVILSLSGSPEGVWLLDGERPLDELPTQTFKMRGLERGETTLLKGHTKKRGAIRLSYQEARLLHLDGSPLDIDQLSKDIEAYWMEKMG